jgi:LmbE family N-acetylglucosaminyl deacetylase
MKILFVSAHTDDIEFNCSVTISKLIKKHDVAHIVFSPCYEAMSAGYNKNAAKKEWAKAQESLGIKECKLFNYPVRRFPQFRQEILQDLIDYKREYLPDLIFCPYPGDVHQDHSQLGKECLRAFHGRSIVFFGSLKSPIPKPNYFVPFSESEMDWKKEIVNIYKSQVVKEKHIIRDMVARNSASAVELRNRYAEAFFIYRLVNGALI